MADVTARLRRHAWRHRPTRAVALWLAAMGALSLLALAEELVSHDLVFVPAAVVAAAGAYLAGRRQGSRRPSRRDRARRLEDAQRLG